MIPLPLQPKIIEKKGNYARFEIEALYPGYGVTIGNSLRRILLSSLEGAAVTQMKMKNVPHEFSTIPGVLEDVILIMLNLKQMRFRLYTQEPQKGFLKVKGEKEVKGSDFELPSQVELVNPDCHIATLTQKSSELEMEIQIEKGIGYSPKEARGREKLEIGTIPIDAIFTPVKRVAFQVENMRVGERTDFDRLFLEVETDGTISPEAAFSQTSEILVKHFSLLAESFKEKAEILRAEIPVEKKKAKVAKKKTKRKKTTTGRHYTLHPPASGPIKGRKFSL
ncbi:MAG: DNA-directed RNA polymerase subunit alpha [Candidatus Nealsonbacteria bacterium CG10_big_fil_rev_8_21_14_0_10_36_228]|uniref:DNA-directed RNA polymerase subunit alpha n=1 Tax=Candidatus Nealsonbacteria bacterium CG10_big_fil_rev_8_21_14_0_10_36_228 TaxID=1974708 RepID=A0A2H0TK21_9BACT|nr:MAG: DNA-directed RNA polymerase subunit alpha [Candidatus Nealsonbacteria bacterium CG10_big_fil_rev_8_21_14_0_10_36_228]